MSIDTDFSTILDAYERELQRSALPWNRWEAVRDSGAFALTVPEDSTHPLLQHGRGYIAYAGLSRTFREYYAQILLPIDEANRAGQQLRTGEYPLLLDDFQLYFLQTMGPAPRLPQTPSRRGLRPDTARSYTASALPHHGTVTGHGARR